MNVKFLIFLLLLVSVGFAYVSPSCDEHISVFLKMDVSGSDLISECSQLGYNNGTKGTAGIGEGVLGNGTLFAGAQTNAGITNKTLLLNYGQVTIDFYLNTTTNTSTQGVMTVGSNNFDIHMIGGVLSSQFRLSGVTEIVTSSHIRNDEFTHFALQYNGSHVEHYRDDGSGTMVRDGSSNAASGSVQYLNPTSVFCIGSATADRSACDSNYFTGVIDEVIVSTVARYGNNAVPFSFVSPPFTDCNASMITDAQVLSQDEVCNQLNITSTGSVDTAGFDLTVLNGVEVNGTLDGNAGAMEFGSLTINSGGTYSATSGTTVITSKNGANLALDNDGAFTANSGLVNITNAVSHSLIDLTGTAGGQIYDLEINSGAYVVQATNDLTIDNDLTITSGTFGYVHADRKVTVTGDVDVTGTLGQGGSTGAMSFGSLTINSGGEYEATSGTTTITSEDASGAAFNNTGTFTHNNGLVNFTITADSAGITGDLSTFYNVEINIPSDKEIVSQSSNFVASNDLTISSGRFKIGNLVLADSIMVSGDVDVTGTLGRADSLATGDYSFGSLTINSGGTYSATSGTTTITSETSGNLAINCDGTLTANSGIFSVETIDDTQHDLLCTGNLYDLILNTSGDFSATKVWVVDNDLTITTGNLFHSTLGVTVGGDVVINGGSLTGGSAAMIFGSLTINSGGTYSATSGTTTITSEFSSYAINSAGTFTHNNGNVVIALGVSSTKFRLYGSGDFYDLTITAPSSANVNWDTNTLVEHDLTINSLGGSVSSTSGTQTLTVTGDVVINSGGTLGDGDSSVYSFGSLTINSGGTYSATSGTTTITSETGGTPGFALDIEGTFTHNDGLVNITTGAITSIDLLGTGNLYNLELATGELIGVQNDTTIINDLSIGVGTGVQSGAFPITLIVIGNVVISGVLGFEETKDWSFGSLTVNSGGIYNATSGVTLVEHGFVNLIGDYLMNGGFSKWVNVSTVDVSGLSGVGSVANMSVVGVSVFDHLRNSLPDQLVKGLGPTPDEDVGLVGYWKFDDIAYSGTTPDSSGLGNTGTFGNCDVNCYNGQGWSNSALELDGVSQYVNTTSAFQSTFRDSFSIELWIKLDDGQPALTNIPIASLDSAGNNFVSVDMQPTGKIDFVYESNGNRSRATTASAVFVDGQESWNHIVAVLDNNTRQMSIYLNGVQEVIDGTNDGDLDTESVVLSDYTSSDDVFIGARNNAGTIQFPFAGLIDEVRIYNRVLSAAEISAHYGASELSSLAGTAVANITQSFFNSTVWVYRQEYAMIASNESWSYTNETTQIFESGAESVEFMINTTGAGFSIEVLNDTGSNALLNQNGATRGNGTFTFTGTTYHPTNYYSKLNVTNSSGSLISTNVTINTGATFRWSDSYNYSSHAPDNFTYNLWVGSSHTNNKLKNAKKVEKIKSGDLHRFDYDFYGHDISFVFNDKDKVVKNWDDADDWKSLKRFDRYVQKGKFKSKNCNVGKSKKCDYEFSWVSNGDEEWDLVLDSPYPAHATLGVFGVDDVIWVDLDLNQAGSVTYTPSLSEDGKTLTVKVETVNPITEFTSSSLGLINLDNLSWNFEWLGAGDAVSISFNVTNYTLSMRDYETKSFVVGATGDGSCVWNSSLSFVSFSPHSLDLNSSVQPTSISLTTPPVGGYEGNFIWLNCSGTVEYVNINLESKAGYQGGVDPGPGGGGPPPIATGEEKTSGMYLTVNPGVKQVVVAREGVVEYDLFVTSMKYGPHVISVESSESWVSFEEYSFNLEDSGKVVFRVRVDGAKEAGEDVAFITLFVGTMADVEVKVERETTLERVTAGFFGIVGIEEFMGSDLIPGFSGLAAVIVFLVGYGGLLLNKKETGNAWKVFAVAVLVWYLWGGLV